MGGHKNFQYIKDPEHTLQDCLSVLTHLFFPKVSKKPPAPNLQQLVHFSIYSKQVYKPFDGDQNKPF